MLIHASCAAKDGAGVLLSGPAGAGKSDLVLQLLERGFALVADDQVLLEDGVARAPAALAGLLEVRGLGIVRMPYVERALVVLAVRLGTGGERLPVPALLFGVPVVALDGRGASAAAKVVVALECVREPGRMLVGGLVA